MTTANTRAEMKTIYIWFGEWAVWREFPSEVEAMQALEYWQARMNWPMTLA